jgi:hypothetical protein
MSIELSQWGEKVFFFNLQSKENKTGTVEFLRNQNTRRSGQEKSE